jgi:hypothetical protein
MRHGKKGGREEYRAKQTSKSNINNRANQAAAAAAAGVRSRSSTKGNKANMMTTNEDMELLREEE